MTKTPSDWQEERMKKDSKKDTGKKQPVRQEEIGRMIWEQSQEPIKIGQVVLYGPGEMGGTIMRVDIGHNKGRKVQHEEHDSQDIYPSC